MVADLLREECEVRYSEENGRFAAYTLWQANQMFKEYGRFGSGALEQRLLGYECGGADDGGDASAGRIPAFPAADSCFVPSKCGSRYFCHDHPVLEKGSAFDVAHTGCYISYDNDWVRSYNRTARELMEQENVPVNDLYELMQSSESYYKCPDKLHLTEDGYRLCAEQAASMIRKELGL